MPRCFLLRSAAALLLLACTSAVVMDPQPGVANCTLHWFTQKTDHFNWGAPPGNQYTFQQRYFIYDSFWSSEQNEDGSTSKGPIFFYAGNEDYVDLYVNATGLMWENAESFGALLVFAEHRFYGESLPFKPGTPGCMNWLSTEQAMADYAYLITSLKEKLDCQDSAVIAFGGSYGGMISSWFRMKYPNIVDGSIAASAPIWSFSGMTPPYDYDGFNKVVTRDASAAGGSTDSCSQNVKRGLERIDEVGKSEDGRKMLSASFLTCNPLRSYGEAYELMEWVSSPWATMAMGNFPYPSSYLLHGHGLLPAYPVRAACEPIGAVPVDSPDGELFVALREGISVYYNHTGTETCFFNGQNGVELTNSYMTTHKPLRDSPYAQAKMEQCQGDWDYQWCTEMTQPFTQGTDEDMFYPYSPYNITASSIQCMQTWGVEPQADWARIGLLGKRIESASNIFFSNGLLDPWSAGGVTTNVSESLEAFVIPNGAHHLDLMFSNPSDPADVVQARERELAAIKRWIAEADARRGKTKKMSEKWASGSLKARKRLVKEY